MTAAVYVVGGPATDDREDLRHSLRSLANTPVDEVWIVGDVPSWVRNVHALPLEPQPEKFANQRASLTAVVNDPELPETFTLFNDDHFVVEPLDLLPAFHLGHWNAYMARQLRQGQNPMNTWWRGVCETADWMCTQGHPNPRVYEAHTPLTFNKAKLAEVLEAYPQDRRFCVGMTYDLTGAGGTGFRGINVKCKTDDEYRLKTGIAPRTPFLSSTDDPFQRGLIGAHIRGMFPDPSPFERT